MLAGIEALLEDDPSTEIVGGTSDVEELQRIMEMERPDVVVAEVSEEDGALVSLIGDAHGVVLLAGDLAGRLVRTAMRRGASVLPRDAGGRTILAAVEAVATGLVVVDPFVARSELTAARVGSPTQSGAVEPLTGRETEVLAMLSEGLGNKVIARRMGIS